MSEQSKDAPRIKTLMDYVREDPEGFARAESELAQSEEALKQSKAAVSTVKRYHAMYGMAASQVYESNTGDYVRYEDYALLQAEHEEQSRLLGMSGSVEAALRAQVQRYASALKQAKDIIGTGSYSYGVARSIMTLMVELDKM